MCIDILGVVRSVKAMLIAGWMPRWTPGSSSESSRGPVVVGNGQNVGLSEGHLPSARPAENLLREVFGDGFFGACGLRLTGKTLSACR